MTGKNRQGNFSWYMYNLIRLLLTERLERIKSAEQEKHFAFVYTFCGVRVGVGVELTTSNSIAIKIIRSKIS